MLRGRRQRGLEREGGDLSPLSSLPKTISHIIQASMEGRTEGTILGGLTPRSQFRTIAPLGPQGDATDSTLSQGTSTSPVNTMRKSKIFAMHCKFLE